jgi:hypothetical protein
MSLLSRFALAVLISSSLTSCQTLGGLMGSFPFRYLDMIGGQAMRALGENELPANGRPEGIQERARKIDTSGLYAGHAQKPVVAPKARMAAR